MDKADKVKNTLIRERGYLQEKCNKLLLPTTELCPTDYVLELIASIKISLDKITSSSKELENENRI